MSLQDFIQAMVKDIQDAATKKIILPEQPPPQRTEPGASVGVTGGEEEETKIEVEVPVLIRKKTKRGNRAKTKQDAALKIWRKEKVRKSEHEQVRQPVQEVVGEREKNRVAVRERYP